MNYIDMRTEDGCIIAVKQTEKGGVAYGGFVWPKSGIVEIPIFTNTTNCDAGGLYAWPWGFSLGDGKELNIGAEFRLLKVYPDDGIIQIEGKIKFKKCEVLEVCLNFNDAIQKTMKWRQMFCDKNSDGNSQTGYMGSASQTGYMGSASQTGDRGSASQTGDMGSASTAGTESIAFCSGIESKASGAIRCWIVLPEWYKDKNEKWHIRTVKTAKVDGKKIKANVFYTLKSGKFVKA